MPVEVKVIMEASNNNITEFERVLLVGVDAPVKNGGERGGEKVKRDFGHSMKELEMLAEAGLMTPVGQVTQKLDYPNSALYVGPGKLEEIKEKAEALEAGLIIFNDMLTPSQLRNLQDGTGLPVMDRTGLILDIFERRARTHEAKLQVETARLKYLMPRLIGMRDALTRQGGTSGSMSSRGAGEKQLELDRRRIEKRLSELRRELENVSRERDTQRKKRSDSGLPLVALAGYTNAGKSTLMNRLIVHGSEEKQVFEADMLFATLDTSVRKINAGKNKNFLLSDTVGFIEDLPHDLVKAFRSTLDEIKNADLILHVVDCSDEHFNDHIRVTKDTLKMLDAGAVPVITVFNKADLCTPPVIYPRLGGVRNAEEVRTDRRGSSRPADRIYISAKDDASIDMLLKLIADTVYGDYEEAVFLVPYKDGAVSAYLMENTEVISVNYEENGTLISCRCSRADRNRYTAYET